MEAPKFRTEDQILVMLHQAQTGMTFDEIASKYLNVDSIKEKREFEYEVKAALVTLLQDNLISSDIGNGYHLRQPAEGEYVFLLVYRDYSCGDYDNYPFRRNSRVDLEYYDSITQGQKFYGVLVEEERKQVRRQYNKTKINKIVRDENQNIIWIDEATDQPQIKEEILTNEIPYDQLAEWAEFTKTGFAHKAIIDSQSEWRFIRRVYKLSMFVRFMTLKDFVDFTMRYSPYIESDWDHSWDLFGNHVPYIRLGLND